jgi:uncharacterized membrane protein YhaH (DUF805 family)
VVWKSNSLKKTMRAFKTPFSFNGRIDRKDFIIAFATFLIMGLLIFGLIYNLCYEVLYYQSGYYFSNYDGINTDWYHDDIPDIIIASIFLIPHFWYLFASGTKRLHDVGLSGWLQLIYPISIFIILFKKGQDIDNQYGESLFSDHSNSLSKTNITEVPNICPQCKNPNTAMLSSCEWCGNQII